MSVLCNITIKKDNKKERIHVFDYIDTCHYLTQLDTIKEVKFFNSSFIFKDIKNNYLVIDFNKSPQFIEDYKNYLKFYFFNQFNNLTSDFITNIDYYKF